MPNLRLLVISAMLSLVLGLAACGGGGGYGSGSGGGSASAAAPSKLFAADSPHMAIGSLVNPNPPAGPLAVDRAIGGQFNYPGFINIGSLALDTTNDRLYVGNGTSIRVFNNASQADGDIFPDRVITNNPASDADATRCLSWCARFRVRHLRVLSGACFPCQMERMHRKSAKC